GAHAASGIGAGAVDVAVDAARKAARSVVLDIDHRPSFGTPGGAEAVAARLAALIEVADVVVGTEEEWRIAGNAETILPALRSLRARSAALLVVKRGARGSVVFGGAIPAYPDGGIVVPGFPVALVNPLGAGDAFMAGFVARYLDGAAPEDCARQGNACGAIVAARLLCSAASPTARELAGFLAGAPASPDPPRAAVARNAPATILALAIDHRAQFAVLAARYGRDARSVAAFKSAGCAALRDLASAGAPSGSGFGILLDREYGAASLDSLAAEPAPLWIGVPVERSGSRPLTFEAGRDLGSALIAWPEAHVVKCLALYHPDDPPELRAVQDAALMQAGEAARRLGRALLVELVAAPFGAVGEATLAELLAHLYALGLRPDWWKLEMQGAQSWRRIEAVIRRNDPDCRGVLVLGRDAGDDDLAAGIAMAAASPVVTGFAIGRAIWQDAAERFFSGAAGEAEARDMIATRFLAAASHWWRNRKGNSP
ncbi:MAG TPA: PfkB family carbohydrate kinase, partial [Acidiphilium sp.]